MRSRFNWEISSYHSIWDPPPIMNIPINITILPVVLCGCELEHSPKGRTYTKCDLEEIVDENNWTWERVREESGKLNNEEVHKLYSH